MTEHAKHQLAIWLPIIIAALAALGGGGAFVLSQWQAHEALVRELADEAKKASAEEQKNRLQRAAENEKIVSVYLVNVQTDLDRAAEIKNELDNTYSYNKTGVLESYVYNARERHGAGLQMELNQIHALADRNKDIEFRVKSYLPCAGPRYHEASLEFLKYADIWLARAASIEVIAKTTESIPVFATFPADFPAALQAEIARRRTMRADAFPGFSCIADQVAPESP
jgi:hypothetical protein